MDTDFATIGQQLKQKYPQYQNVDDATLGQLYLKKTNPLQYKMLEQKQQNAQNLQQTQAISDIQAAKELDVNQKKMKQEQEFKIKNPAPLTPKEQADLDAAKEVKDKAARTKNETIALADELLNRDTGAVTGVPNVLKMATGEYQYTKNLIKQLQAKLSLSGREQLKGSGQISDFEAKMLADSASALKTNLSNEDFSKELKKIQMILKGENPKEAQQSNPQNTGPQTGLGADAKDILNKILGIPSQVASIPQDAMALQKQYGSLGQSIVSGQGPGRELLTGSTMGMLPEYNRALGEPMKGGDIVGRITQRAQEKPLTTALDVASVLPFLKGGKVAPKVTEVKTGPSVSDIPNLSAAEKLAVKAAETVAGGTKKAGGVMPRAWLTKAKTNAFKLYEDVKVDTSTMDKAAKDFIKRYPSAKSSYDKYKTAIKSVETPKELDSLLQELGDAFKTNKEIKPGIGNDLIGELWKAGRKELATKAPVVDKIKKTMGETMDISKAAGKALWKGVLTKLLLGR